MSKVAKSIVEHIRRAKAIDNSPNVIQLRKLSIDKEIEHIDWLENEYVEDFEVVILYKHEETRQDIINALGFNPKDLL